MLKKGLTGTAIKMIAAISMAIDHIGAVIVARFMAQNGIKELDSTNEAMVQEWLSAHGELYWTYTIMRVIGRIAFPVFCFMLIQGLEHTRSWKKYALRLGVFALISEIPFDLAITGKVLEFQYQNVFFTLLIGLLAMVVYHRIEEQEYWSQWMRYAAGILLVLAGMALARFIRADYGGWGILAIMVFYMFRNTKKFQIAFGGVVFMFTQLWAVLSLLPMGFYNGERGWNIKYAFYIFYPAHLLILYLICYFMGIGGISTI